MPYAVVPDRVRPKDWAHDTLDRLRPIPLLRARTLRTGYADIAFHEERWLPGPHAIPAKRMRLSATTTPILVTDAGSKIRGSDLILDWVGMHGGDPELERRFHRIGAIVRQLVPAATLSTPSPGVREALLAGVPPRQALAGRLIWRGTRRLMALGMQANPAIVPSLIERLGAELDWLPAVMKERGDYLVGDEFGRADLTAASLLAPLAIPPDCPVANPYRKVRLPDRSNETVLTWRNEPALAWVARTYSRHRARRSSAMPQPSHAS